MEVSKKDRLFFGTVYFVQGAVALSSLALLHFQKDILGLSAAELATFGSLITLLAWSFKPIYGLISDVFPINGQRRKPYLILCSLLTLFSYLYLGAYSHDYLSTLVPLVLANIGLGFTDVLCDGLVVQKSTKENVGKLQNLCWGSKFFAIFIVSIVGGFLNEALGIAQSASAMDSLSGIKVMFYVTAIFPLLTLLQVLTLEEEKIKQDSMVVATLKSAAKNVYRFVRKPIIKKTFWGFLGSLVFIFMWRAAPSAGAPLQYFVINERGFNDSYLGITGSVAYLGHLLGYFVYGKWIDKLPIRKVFFWTITIGTLFGLTNLLILSDWEPKQILGITVHYKQVNLVIDFVAGLIFYCSFLPILKLAAEICPKGKEATMFAIIASIMNLGLSLSSYLGGSIFSGQFNEDFSLITPYYLTILGCNLLVLPFILLLPKKQQHLEF